MYFPKKPAVPQSRLLSFFMHKASVAHRFLRAFHRSTITRIQTAGVSRGTPYAGAVY